jgi:hypothetical protein
MRFADTTGDVIPGSAVRAAGWGSVMLGGAALVLLVTTPAPFVAVLAGTAGIVAAATGLAAVKTRRSEVAVPAIGIVIGALAAVLLVAQLGTTLLARSDAADRPGPAAETTAVPAPTRAALAGAVNTLAYVLAQARGESGGWPATLAVTGDGRIYATAGPNIGHLLLQAPAGATVSYDVSADRTRCVLTMTATTDPTVAVRYSSTSGLSTND